MPPTATMLVKAAPGIIFYGPGGVRITDAAPVRVPATTHYRRGLRSGDLVPGDAAPASAPAVDPTPVEAPASEPLAAAPEPAPTAPIRRRAQRVESGEES